MFIYQPEADKRTRVIWGGGKSTQIHYQHRANTGEWVDIEIRTLGGGIPSGTKEIMQEMRDFYNYCS